MLPNCTPSFLFQSTLSYLLLWLSFALFSVYSLTNDKTLKYEEMQTALYEVFRSLKLASWLWKTFLLHIAPLLRNKRICTDLVKHSIYTQWLRFCLHLLITKGNTDFFSSLTLLFPNLFLR